MGKVRFGLDNVHYSVYTPATGTDDASWATPVAWGGAVSLSLDIEGDENSFFADNSKWYATATNNGYSGTIEMATFDDSIKTALLGYRTVTTSGSSTADLVEVSDAVPAKFALLFRISGNEEKKGYCFYMCELGRPGITAETTSESTDPQTFSLPITITPIENAAGIKVLHRTHTLGEGTSETFFSTAPTLPTLDA